MLEARCLARRLRERLDAGWPVFDRATNATRRAHPGDVALLFRAMTDLWPYEAALADEGFDYHTIGGSAFYAQQEVHDVINLLSVVEDPFDAVALAGALRSPFFGVSDEGLFWLATTFEDGGLTAGIHRLDEIAGLSPRDRHRLTRALELLSRWRSAKDRVPMARLVARVLDESGFEAAVVCEFLGERKRANARKLVRLARRLRPPGRLHAGRIRRPVAGRPRERAARGAGRHDRRTSDSIRLMSIHQAKGLEFPIVVLPDLARGEQPEPAGGIPSGPRPGGATGEPSPGSAVSRARPRASRRAIRPRGVSRGRPTSRSKKRMTSRNRCGSSTWRPPARDALILSAGLGPDEPVKSSSPAMRLLDERFDRRTGECRVAPGESTVEVRLMSPPEPGGERAAPTPRSSIAAIEEAITRAAPIESSDPERPATSPRYLDLDPTAGLTPRAARLDGLTRSMLRRPRLASRRTPRVDRHPHRGAAGPRREREPGPRGRPADRCPVGPPRLPSPPRRRPGLGPARLRLHDARGGDRRPRDLRRAVPRSPGPLAGDRRCRHGGQSRAPGPPPRALRPGRRRERVRTDRPGMAGEARPRRRDRGQRPVKAILV